MSKACALGPPSRTWTELLVHRHIGIRWRSVSSMGHVEGILVWFSHRRKLRLLLCEGNVNVAIIIGLVK